MLEPRRLAARAAATQMARLVGEQVGCTVGYRTRLDTRVGRSTRIEVVTEGVLTRMLLRDPTLDGYGMVIFDEFHERSLHGDTALALTRLSRELVRPDLRVLMMSATLDGTALANHLGGAPIVTCEGRQFPVLTEYAPRNQASRLDRDVARAVRDALRDQAGDVLVFLPGAPEIHRVASMLDAGALPSNVFVTPLHGQLLSDEQDRAIAAAPGGFRKVVLATSIAETSLTIEGVRVVIDSGFSRVPRFSPRTGMTRLETVRVTRAAADQRCGRAGRVAPGVCVRLWHEQETGQLVPSILPEILEADLVPLALDLAFAGIADPRQLAWIDPPPRAAYAQALDLLRQLAAVDQGGRITEQGRRMAQFGTHPRLAHMILRGGSAGLGALACDLAALLGERDPVPRQAASSTVDLRLRLDLLRDDPKTPSDARVVSRHLLDHIREQSRRWRAALGAKPEDYDREACGRVLAMAYPDRAAQRRRGSAPRYVMRNGMGVVLPEGDALSREPFLVVAETDGKQPEGRVYLAAPLSGEDLEHDFAPDIQQLDHVEWSDELGMVRANRQRRLGALVLSDHALLAPHAGLVAAAVAEAGRRHGLAFFPWHAETIRLRDRLRFLRQHDASWPDVSDEALCPALFAHVAPQLGSIRSANDLRRIDVREALLALLTWEQRRQIEDSAPTHFMAPSGSRIPIDYTDSAAPSIAVRVQEMFGCATTPSILGGRVPLTLHLLSPAQRPVQVTRDLAGFWRDAYHEVRKDLRGRYPKHEWPENPLAAAPTSKVTRRR
jgi:ATP-dependent helicase HrpB